MKRHNKTFVNAEEEAWKVFIHSHSESVVSGRTFVLKFIFCCLFLYRCYFVNLIKKQKKFLGEKNYFISKLFMRTKTIFQSTEKTTGGKRKAKSWLEFYLLLRRLDFLRSSALTTSVLRRRGSKWYDVILLCKL